MASRLTNTNSKSSSSSSLSKQVPGNSGITNNGGSKTSQGQSKTNSNNTSRNTPFQTGIDHVDAIINQSSQSKSTSSTKPKRPPLRAQPPADPPPPGGDNAVDDDVDGYGTTRTFQFSSRTPTNTRLSLQELITSPHLLNSLDRSVTLTRQPSTFNPSTSSMSNISLDDVMVSRRMTEPSSSPTPGTIAWLCDPTNITGYNLYPDLKASDQFDEVTRQMCELSSLDYYSTYRQVLSVVGTMNSQQTGLPDLSSPNELVLTEHIFKNWVNAIARKFSNRFPTIFQSLLNPDPFNDPRVRSYFMDLLEKNSGKRPTGLTSDERLKICSLLQTKVGEYNKANSFLAEVIRATITAQHDLFPALHNKIKTNHPTIYDAHSLFYGVKYEMAKGKERLLKTTRKSMDNLDIAIKDGIPLLREYVVELQDLAFKYRELNGTVTDAELLDLMQTKGKELLAKHPHLRNLTHFVSMIQPDNPQYDTWDKQLLLHSALQDMVAEQRSADAYQKHLDAYGSQTVSSTTTSKSKSSVSQPVANAATPAQSNLPVATNTSILPTAKCLIHPNGSHTNGECSEQSNIRNQKLRQDQLIAVLKQLQQRVTKKKLEQRRQRGANRKQSFLDKKQSDQDKSQPTPKLLTNTSHSDDISTTSSTAQTKKSSSSKRSNDEVQASSSQGSVASGQAKKRKVKAPEPTEETAHAVLRLRGGGDPPDDSDHDDEDRNWKHRDDYEAQYTQDDPSEDEEDIGKVHGIADDNDFTFPSNEITDEDRALMTSVSSLSGSVTSLHYPNVEEHQLDVSTNDLPFKTDTTLTPLKVDKGIQATPDEDDIVLMERNRVKAAREIEFDYNSPMQKGFPTATLNDHGILTVDGLDIYEFGYMYGQSVKEFGYESLKRQRMHMRFELFFDQVQEYNRINGLPLLNRTTMCDGLVDVADLLWEARQEILSERQFLSPPKKSKQNHPVSNITHIDSNFLTLLYRANGTTESKSTCTKRRVDSEVAKCSSSSSSVTESSLDFKPRKRIKVTNGKFYINQIANVVTVNSAHYVIDDNYDTIIDSGASSHITNDVKYATLDFNYRPANPYDGVALGDNSIKLRAIGYCDIGILRHVMIVPKMTVNLVSSSRLDLLGYATLIKDQMAQLIKGTQVIVKGPLIRGLYHVKLT